MKFTTNEHCCNVDHVKLSAEEREALVQYRDWAGKDWKRKLRLDWVRSGSRFPGSWAPLQRVRNRLGPTWLECYEPEQATDHETPEKTTKA